MDRFRKALLVEDELALAETIKIALKRVPIDEVRHVQTIGEAEAALREWRPELVVLDRNLPDGDGMELAPRLRADGFRGAILMLTARGLVSDRVEGLKGGADDYLTKPFAWEELVARIESLARRVDAATLAAGGAFGGRSGAPGTGDRTARDGADGGFAKGAGGAASVAPWALDEDRLRVHSPAKGWVTLTSLEFKLVKHLISNEGKCVSREELLKDVWGFRFLPKTRTVDFFMGRLRKMLEENPDSPAHFQTIRGQGYLFMAAGEE